MWSLISYPLQVETNDGKLAHTGSKPFILLKSGLSTKYKLAVRLRYLI